MQTMRELIDQGFFETDEDGNAFVPVVGNPSMDGTATILVTDAPGDYPIVGLGPMGYATAWDEHGVMRPDRARNLLGQTSEWDPISQLSCSLKMPRVEAIRFYTVIDREGYVVDTFEDLADAKDSLSGDGEQIVTTDSQRYVVETLEEPSGFLRAEEPGEVSPGQALNEPPFGGFYRGLDFGTEFGSTFGVQTPNPLIR